MRRTQHAVERRIQRANTQVAAARMRDHAALGTGERLSRQMASCVKQHIVLRSRSANHHVAPSRGTDGAAGTGECRGLQIAARIQRDVGACRCTVHADVLRRHDADARAGCGGVGLNRARGGCEGHAASCTGGAAGGHVARRGGRPDIACGAGQRGCGQRTACAQRDVTGGLCRVQHDILCGRDVQTPTRRGICGLHRTRGCDHCHITVSLRAASNHIACTGHQRHITSHTGGAARMYVSRSGGRTNVACGANQRGCGQRTACGQRDVTGGLCRVQHDILRGRDVEAPPHRGVVGQHRTRSGNHRHIAAGLRGVGFDLAHVGLQPYIAEGDGAASIDVATGGYQRHVTQLAFDRRRGDAARCRQRRVVGGRHVPHDHVAAHSKFGASARVGIKMAHAHFQRVAFADVTASLYRHAGCGCGVSHDVKVGITTVAHVATRLDTHRIGSTIAG